MQNGNYSSSLLDTPIPSIIDHSSYPADIEKTKAYFSDENVIRTIAIKVGMQYDILTNGSFQILIEPMSYFTAQQTLDTVQSLYEKKLATYPRTDSRYLTTDMADGVPELMHRSASILSFNIVQPIKCDTAKIIDNSKVQDHHAIITTLSISSVDLTRLTDPEQSILRMLAVRLICAVAEAHVYSEVVVTVDCEGNSFSSKGKTVVHQGWKGIEQNFLEMQTVLFFGTQ